MSSSSESLRAKAVDKQRRGAPGQLGYQPSGETANEDPIVSSLLTGTKDIGGQIEALVRHESALQGVSIDRETAPRFSYVRFVKPVIDRVVAAIALIFLLPVFVSIALAIKLTSRGPVFFVQRRTGYLGRRFSLYKFRTMVQNAEDLKKDLMAENIFGEDSPDFKLKDDPRITRIGSFLRKSSLDELPNLINVLLGDMSLVGPRPTSFKATTYRKSHLPRLAATPGLTGLWQVSGRADVDFDERSDLDAHYIRIMSFQTDLHIFCKTVSVVFKRRGAY